MPSREQYVAQRVGARMQNRGEKVTLRRRTLLAGPVPYANPPDVSAGLVVTTGIIVAGHDYFGITGTGSSIVGRLVPGDIIQCVIGGVVQTAWTVGTMPTNVLTDGDGIPIADPDGTPHFGSPAIYYADSLAANGVWTVIPVVPSAGSPDPAASIGQAVQFVFLADQQLYGVPLSKDRMTAWGWTEVDAVGMNLAAYNGGAIAPPKVNDQLILLDGSKRNIISLSQINRNGVNFLYPVQAR